MGRLCVARSAPGDSARPAIRLDDLWAVRRSSGSGSSPGRCVSLRHVSRVRRGQTVLGLNLVGWHFFPMVSVWVGIPWDLDPGSGARQTRRSADRSCARRPAGRRPESDQDAGGSYWGDLAQLHVLAWLCCPVSGPVAC